MPSTILIKRGTTDPTAANVTNSGELAANTTTPKLFIKTASDSVTAPIWIGATIESSPSDWTSASKLATQSAINTTFMPKSGGAFTGDVTLNAQSDLRFADSDSSNWVAFQAPATVASNVTWTLPSADGTNGQVLMTNGTGTLSFADASSATTVTTSSDNTATTRYLVFSTSAGSGKTLYVDDTTSTLTYNPNTGVITGTQFTGNTVGTHSGNVTTSGLNGTLTITSQGSDSNAVISLTGAATPFTTATITADSVTLAQGNLTMGGTSGAMELPTTFTIADTATVTNTLNIQTGATASAATKTINIGTGGQAGSTTNINLGSTNGTCTVTVNKDLVVTGNLTINGTTTTVNSTTLTIDDKNIVLGNDNTLDSAADGGGITLNGATPKTLNWVDATDAWTSSEHFNLLTGKAFYINGVSVLSSNTLGSGVTASSLTSVGTITTGVWNGTDIALADGGTNASLTAVNGGIVYSTASAMAITSAGTSGQLLTSGGAGAPTWTSQSSITAGNATVAATVTLTATNTTNATHYLTFVDAATGNEDMRTDTALSYNPSTNILTAGTVEATIDGGTY